MGKLFLRLFLLVFVIALSFIIYISYFGIETDKFDSLIKEKANEAHKYVKLDFKKTKIHLSPSKLNLAVKLQNPKVMVKENEIELSKLNLFLSLKSFFGSDFLLNRAEIAFYENDIKDLTKITSLFLPKIINKRLNKIFEKGKLEGEFIIPFETDGSMGKDYGFSGKILNASINLTKDFPIKNLTTEINYEKEIENGSFTAIIKKGSLLDLDLAKSTIKINRGENTTKIITELYKNGKFNFSQIKRASSLFAVKEIPFKDIKGSANLKTDINFDLDKKYKVKNLKYITTGSISYLEVHTDSKKIIKKYLPEYEPTLILKKTNIKLIKSNSDQKIELEGLIKMNKNDFDNFKISEKYNYNKKRFEVNGNLDLTNSKVLVSRLNYIKDYDKKSDLNFDINFVLNKYYNIKDLKFVSNKSKIYLSNIKLDKNFKTLDFEKIEIKTFLDDLKNNDFIAKKSEKIEISGEVFDAEPLLKSLYKKNKKKMFSKKFKSEVKIDFAKTLTGTNDIISDFAMIALINKGSYEKLNLKGNFSNNEIVEMSIYQIDKNKKSLQVISDRAKPFLKNFKFIEGFEGGKLEYESIIFEESSNANLKITDFKVSKVPALAKLLTLASLQGIADTLSGEGIRFETFEMKSVTKGNWMDIEETYASGPAVSILLDGYIDRGKTISLRGTLVPATTLNSIISTIPLVGSILVGKKTGEGVFGVSFKMKGPPKNIKTTVNPIKTLTPRFIVRAMEKIKKQKKKEAK